ncbi:NAD(P)H-dependent FMN reductase [Algoriphagus ratkowskyi]|uniref:NAD(P)H-dependent FMN reductase n=1 Tax=Algoriphagus ratkowskyi TaxID=57028 RepID=A0A2W7S9V7_9BACT|nr:NAD(P)H-dependent oxidoreductase [Algoriphagus ratkowskyi]PZX59645.1 NAD(P)H-dependent FMN reductase [Algoriphagus ratkowskyi]TXD78633.1 NAD(P)H-dependent oxidoreductase [Algoriphagus ratkowskyi]
MIKIIVGTNRKNSVSKTIAELYQRILNEKGVQSEILELENLPSDFIENALYENNGKHDLYNEFHDQLVDGKKFVFIVPEYNGSFPGILKTFIDGMTYPNTFGNKKCALVGISSGIGGGGIAMSHLTDIFHYLGMHVLALKPKLAKIEQNMSDNLLTNRLYMDLLQTQADMLLEF